MLGMAGAGKTTLTRSFAEWLINRGEVVKIVNLDPGTIRLPYNPDFDVREIANLVDIMRNEGLGPNGGLLRANQIILQRINEISKRILELNKDASYVIIDTPGQLELFAFRELGSKIISELGAENSVGIFIVDSFSIEKPSDVVMAMLLTLAIRFHLDIEVVMILNKIDLVGSRVIELFRRMYSNPGALIYQLEQEGSGLLAEMGKELVNIIRGFLPPARVIGISALRGTNLEEVFSVIHDVFCGCGDLM